MKLKISNTLSLPLDSVTQAIGILAKRRAGKSYCARRLCEQLLHAGQQVVIVDPKGDWFGIRSASDGKRPGFPVVIIGGERGDVRLEPGSGEIVAKLVVEERVSVLLDLSLLRKHEVATFMGIFLENLYRLKAREEFRTPLMLMIDEADAVAPQKPQKGEERMLGAAEDIVRRGGQRGIGCTLISQRSAVLNKNVLTQIQVLIALRTIAPQDLAALDAWVEVHGTRQQRDTLMQSLPSLPVGDAWFWSPGWPSDEGIFQRVSVLPIETFDSGATPKPGEKRIEPRNLADVDLGALERKMAETIERAKADDPKELRKKIAELERQLKSIPAPVASNKIDPEALKKAFERGVQSVRRGLAKELAAYGKVYRRNLRHAQNAIQSGLKELNEGLKAFDQESMPAPRMPSLDAIMIIADIQDMEKAALTVTKLAGPMGVQKFSKAVNDYVPPKKGVTQCTGATLLSGPQQRIIDAIAWLEDIGVEAPEQTAAAFLAGYSAGGGAFNNPRGQLNGMGMVEYVAGGKIRLTDQGRAAANHSDTVLTPVELQRHVLARLPGPEQRILTVLLSKYPHATANDDCARAAGYEPGGGAFNNPRGRLRSLGLIEYPQPGMLKARPLLFLETQ